MKTLKTVIWTLIVLVVLGALGGFFFIESGAYDVAATSPPSGIERFLAGAVRHRSISVREGGVTVPNLQDPGLVRLGYSRYDDMCVICHSAPGLKETPVGRGLNPHPPHLWSKGTQSMSDQRMYWVVDHGIRMTGMPGFGPSLDERDLWSLVAVIRQLPNLRPGEFQQKVDEAEKAEGESGETSIGAAEAGGEAGKAETPPAGENMAGPAPQPTHPPR